MMIMMTMNASLGKTRSLYYRRTIHPSIAVQYVLISVTTNCSILLNYLAYCLHLLVLSVQYCPVFAASSNMMVLSLMIDTLMNGMTKPYTYCYPWHS